MSEFLICCAMYEKGRPFLMQWMQAVAVAARGHDAAVLVVTDNLADAESALKPLRNYLPINVAHAAPGSSIADVRRVLLQTASTGLDAKILCFVDMDDLLAENALPQHRAALADHDFSYGDLLLIDEVGLPLGHSLFEGNQIPSHIAGVESILERNFLGLSNTALWCRAVPQSALNVPSDVFAVDWWLFSTLLMHGCRARRTENTVCQYRTYGGNLIGGQPGVERAAILRRCDMVLKHYEKFRHDARFVRREARVSFLRDQFAAKSEWADGLPAKIRVGVWWEDISRLADFVWEQAENAGRSER